MWRLNNMLLKNQWFNKKIKEEIRKPLETNENKNITFQNLWDVAKAKRKVYSNTGLPQETRKISNKQPKSHLRELEKTNKPTLPPTVSWAQPPWSQKPELISQSLLLAPVIGSRGWAVSQSGPVMVRPGLLFQGFGRSSLCGFEPGGCRPTAAGSHLATSQRWRIKQHRKKGVLTMGRDKFFWILKSI